MQVVCERTEVDRIPLKCRVGETEMSDERTATINAGTETGVSTKDFEKRDIGKSRVLQKGKVDIV